MNIYSNMDSEMLRSFGVVKWFSASRGYGFITNCVTKDDIFVHFSSIKPVDDTSYKLLMEGEYVSYSLSKLDDEKDVAVDVTGIYGGKLRCDYDTRNRNGYRRPRKEEKTEPLKTDDSCVAAV